jgi:cation diffusion facilitator CzcD-associated flavoprotein CzcO
MMRVAVIGAGMAGLLAAIELRRAGHEPIVFEKADRLGGTWRDNTYPGLSCDVPAHSYTYSFARNPDWSRHYASGDEIQGYFERVADEHGLLDLIRFGDEVTSLAWTGDGWDLATESGHRDHVPVVIAATGVLHHPKVPDIDGLDTFAGALFHSARWDHTVPLDGRRVGVVGTGSTAVQITSALVERVAEFSLFQRTAQWVLPADNPEYTAEQQAAFRADPAAHEAYVRELAITMFQRTSSAVTEAGSVEHAKVSALCRRNLERVRDPELRKRLTPDYEPMCKRLIIAGDFYEKIQHPNARLVTERIVGVEPGGVRTGDGQLHHLDVLVLATGFHPDRFIRPTEVIGVDGLDLDDVWSPTPAAYLSVAVPGFPNLFMLNGPNSPIGNFSLIEIAERQMAYVMQLIASLDEGAAGVMPTTAATAAFEAERREAASGTIWMSGCDSWYLDATGVPASWTFTYERFVDEMRAPDPTAYELI